MSSSKASLATIDENIDRVTTNVETIKADVAKVKEQHDQILRLLQAKNTEQLKNKFEEEGIKIGSGQGGSTVKVTPGGPLELLGGRYDGQEAEKKT